MWTPPGNLTIYQTRPSDTGLLLRSVWVVLYVAHPRAIFTIGTFRPYRLLPMGVSTFLPRCRAPHINKKSYVCFFINELSNCKQLYWPNTHPAALIQGRKLGRNDILRLIQARATTGVEVPKFITRFLGPLCHEGYDLGPQCRPSNRSTI